MLIHPTGSGKTRTNIEAVYRQPSWYRPVTVVGSKASLGVWKMQIEQWCPDPNNIAIEIIHGNPQARRMQWADDYGQSGDWWQLTTYETLFKDIQAGIVPVERLRFVLTDEAHKMRNRKTNPYKVIKLLRHAVRLHMSTATPARKGASQNMWTYLNVMSPKVFPSYWRFVKTFCHVDRNHWGGQEILGPKNIASLRQQLQNYCHIVKKDDIRGYLPEVIRNKLPATITAKQQHVYQDFERDMFSVVDGGVMAAPTILARMTRLRQLLAMPMVLDESLGYGGGIETIVEHMRSREEEHVVIFTPFARAHPYVEQFLETKGYENIFTFQGGITLNQQRQREELFGRTRGIALCTTSYAESFEFPTCSTGYMLGFDYSPDVNEQAEGRISRLASEADLANVYYIIHDGTVDDGILEIVNDKYRDINHVLKSPLQLLRELRDRKE